MIHGTDDPLVPVENGKLTAEAIGGAQFVPIDGMGHDMPDGALEAMADAIVSNAHRAAASV